VSYIEMWGSLHEDWDLELIKERLHEAGAPVRPRNVIEFLASYCGRQQAEQGGQSFRILRAPPPAVALKTAGRQGRGFESCPAALPEGRVPLRG
jgi:hypothetical protein